MNEYKAICDYFKGQFIDFSSTSKHYINPLDTDTLQYMDSRSTFLKDKTNLMLSIFSQIKENNMELEDNSIIGRTVQQVYMGVGEKNYKTPTLVEFYRILKEQPEMRAQALALSMELFVTGAMNMFSKPTNVNTKNRFTVYGMADIDRSQSGMGIIIMLESVRSRIAENAKKGKCTWIFIDEFHHLSHNQYSSAYLEKMQYISNPECGCGLLKFGSKVIPCDGRLPRDSAMYQLFNTNFHELAKIRKNKVWNEVRKPNFLYGQLPDGSVPS